MSAAPPFVPGAAGLSPCTKSGRRRSRTPADRLFDGVVPRAEARSAPAFSGGEGGTGVLHVARPHAGTARHPGSTGEPQAGPAGPVTDAPGPAVGRAEAVPPARRRGRARHDFAADPERRVRPTRRPAERTGRRADGLTG
nr:hypothetical protein GCM10017745_58080 [Saccharothrix mutabilis subsp. capreolus]